MKPRSGRTGAIGKWWPTTQSLDLVEGSAEHVAAAVETEVRRFVNDTPVSGSWTTVPDLDAAFLIPAVFTNVPTHCRSSSIRLPENEIA